ncbi:hypothetical protein LTR47_011567 [Exophiala xenobiotica]|nr:hypothetical protein LTR72_011496 [Exophiala xenobiotica]KAK5219294.1 hypothetical protein LTR47_011567 [Exophiala xenobiotica]KAK5244410.1 hypothetical protein LTS06_010012 [Exophiala xenobiotica]KAK5260927.1 hypothetical protein LTR40_003204 [Exophiala xenobiotica]KAK5332582.1 hypothetical protein LTR98_011289 [Exophiala xenobiotica]
MHPDVLNVVIIGDELASWALSRKLLEIGCLTTPYDKIFGTIQVTEEDSNTEEMMIEVSARGGHDTGDLLRWYCSKADAFIIIFRMDSKTSLESSGKFKDHIVEAKKNCSTALVGIQVADEPREVTLPEALNRAAELETTYFTVQANSQVMAPFIYLGHCHARKKPTTSREATRIYGSGDQLVADLPGHQHDHK